ncbi:MAG TPA: DUF4149 domain-containing protein [Nitrospirota bacterium]|nr:DUF4149 domain-containing protein [Nitrospirota bacterium]
MKSLFFSIYTIIIAFWVGGMFLFTFLLTPAIFKSYGRDMAGDIVGHLFPGYFFYTFALSALALILGFLAMSNRTAFVSRLTLLLLAAALVVNTYVFFKLHPDSVSVKQQITSFEHEPKDTPARKEFTRLHAISAMLNLAVLVDGIALIVLAPALRK